MMFLGTGFLLGLVGSLHCAGMCGPLALAVPVVGEGRGAILLSRLTYNLGRIATYAVLGLAAGMLGQAFALAGLQRWVSLAAGVVILAGLVATARWSAGLPVTRLMGRLKAGFGLLMRRRTHGSVFLLGTLNGLLPCGLVYVACAAAVVSPSWYEGVGYMIAFGLGTVPMMFAFGVVGLKLQSLLRFRLQRLVPVSLAVVGGLLLLRGLALGIPYVSPADPATGPACPMCVEHQAEAAVRAR